MDAQITFRTRLDILDILVLLQKLDREAEKNSDKEYICRSLGRIHNFVFKYEPEKY